MKKSDKFRPHDKKKKTIKNNRKLYFVKKNFFLKYSCHVVFFVKKFDLFK